MPVMRFSSRLIGLLAVVLVMSACKVSIQQFTVVNRDGSGTAVVSIGLDDELLTLLEGTEQDVSTFGDSFDERFEVSDFDDGEFTGVRAEAAFETLEELESLLTATPALGEAAERISLDRDGNLFVFDASLGNVADQIGEVAGAGDFISASNFDDIFDIAISLDLPGESIQHNADEVTENGVLVWHLTSQSDGELQASSEVPRSLLPILIAAGVVIAVALGVAVRRRQLGMVVPPSNLDVDGPEST